MLRPSFRFGLLLSLVWLFQACGSADNNRHNKGQGPVDIDPSSPKTLTVGVSSPQLRQEVELGSMSVLDVIEFNGQYAHKIALEIINLKQGARCFLNVALRPVGTNGAFEKTQDFYVKGQMMQGTYFATNACVGAGAHGYVLAYLYTQSPDLTEVVLESIESHSVSTFTPIEQVSIVSKSIDFPFVKVSVKNENVAEGLSNLMFSMWFIKAKGQIVDWGYLSPSNPDKPVIALGEILELQDFMYSLKVLPAHYEWDIILGEAFKNSDG